MGVGFWSSKFLLMQRRQWVSNIRHPGHPYQTFCWSNALNWGGSNPQQSWSSPCRICWETWNGHDRGEMEKAKHLQKFTMRSCVLSTRMRWDNMFNRISLDNIRPQHTRSSSCINKRYIYHLVPCAHLLWEDTAAVQLRRRRRGKRRGRRRRRRGQNIMMMMNKKMMMKKKKTKKKAKKKKKKEKKKEMKMNMRMRMMMMTTMTTMTTTTTTTTKTTQRRWWWWWWWWCDAYSFSSL